MDINDEISTLESINNDNREALLFDNKYNDCQIIDSRYPNSGINGYLMKRRINQLKTIRESSLI